MPTRAGIASEYDTVASLYNDFKELPTFKIEWQLAARGLGDCTGLTVLDLGGGSGLHARQAVDRGATHVDIVDVSPAMLEEGKSTSARLGRPDLGFTDYQEVAPEQLDLVKADYNFWELYLEDPFLTCVTARKQE